MAFVTFSGNSKFNPCPKPEKAEKKKRPRISQISEKRKAENTIYKIEAPLFLKGKICPLEGTPATQVHHKKGRIGKLFLDKKYWLGVSAKGHKWIEEHPEEAKKLGYSLNRL